MSVKDVLQSLVDDNMVDTDRIGTSNYFWSYPSKAVNTVRLIRNVCLHNVPNVSQCIDVFLFVSSTSFTHLCFIIFKFSYFQRMVFHHDHI